MVSPLEGPIRRTIGKALKSTFYAAKITRTVTTGGDPWDPGSGETTITEYSCRGFVDAYSDFYLANSLINSGDVKVVILTDSLATTPTVSDTVTIRGKTYSIINVSPDPALATYTIQARG